MVNKKLKTVLCAFFGLWVFAGASVGIYQGYIQLYQIKGGTSGNIPISNGSYLVSRTISNDFTIGSTGIGELSDPGVTAQAYDFGAKFTFDVDGRATAGTNSTGTKDASHFLDGTGAFSTITTAAAPVNDNFTGNGSATTYTLSGTPASIAFVYFNGNLLISGLTTGFSYTLSGTTLTIKQENATYTASTEDKIRVIYW